MKRITFSLTRLRSNAAAGLSPLDHTVWTRGGMRKCPCPKTGITGLYAAPHRSDQRSAAIKANGRSEVTPTPAATLLPLSRGCSHTGLIDWCRRLQIWPPAIPPLFFAVFKAETPKYIQNIGVFAF
jgi:hypothetical protein